MTIYFTFEAASYFPDQLLGFIHGKLDGLAHHLKTGNYKKCRDGLLFDGRSSDDLLEHGSFTTRFISLIERSLEDNDC